MRKEQRHAPAIMPDHHIWVCMTQQDIQETDKKKKKSFTHAVYMPPECLKTFWQLQIEHAKRSTTLLYRIQYTPNKPQVAFQKAQCYLTIEQEMINRFSTCLTHVAPIHDWCCYVHLPGATQWRPRSAAIVVLQATFLLAWSGQPYGSLIEWENSPMSLQIFFQRLASYKKFASREHSPHHSQPTAKVSISKTYLQNHIPITLGWTE